jgi:hypothetical protein
VARRRSTLFGKVLALVAAVSAPAAANGGMYSRSAVSMWGGHSRTISSPDGTKAIWVRPPTRPESDENHDVVVRAYGREFPTDIGALVNAEAAWSPDSRAFFVTYSDGGNVGTYHVKIFHVSASGLRVTEPIPDGRALFVPRCADPEHPNVGAVRWKGRGSRRLLVAVEVPPHSSCVDMGTFRVFEIELADGRVVTDLNQLEAKTLLRNDLGDELLNADDGCVRRPGTCVPQGVRP